MFSGLPVVVLMILLAALPIACEARKERDESPVQAEAAEYIIGVVVDVSGSFLHLILDQGKGYQFLMELIERFASGRAGDNSRMVISQISAVERALLWDGNITTDLKADFSSPNAFREFILKRSHPAGSRVHDSIADLADYLVECPGVKEGKTKPALFILSDMEDTFPKSDESEKRLVQSLKGFAMVKGIVGMYYVDHSFTAKWRRHLSTDCGFKPGRSIVEPVIKSRPTLPNFED